MSTESLRKARTDYRRRLRESGRREVLIDLPEDLLAKIDGFDGSQRRALVVEKLVRKALRITTRN